MHISIENIGSEIKNLRNKKFLTQSELGDIVGVKKSRISKIESGDLNLTFKTLKSILNALDKDFSINLSINGSIKKLK